HGHDPERRLALIVHLVDPAARVGHLLAVWRELRILNILPIEILVESEEGWRACGSTTLTLLRRARCLRVERGDGNRDRHAKSRDPPPSGCAHVKKTLWRQPSVD